MGQKNNSILELWKKVKTRQKQVIFSLKIWNLDFGNIIFDPLDLKKAQSVDLLTMLLGKFSKNLTFTKKQP
ncbi:hypothetical protein [Mesomycoplasma ovipneumoniae]|uniref:hypothetical protein n=1 Tax=Mesomycoplasma ovipneumoniae TaxID=29562 RepID=UPI003080EFCC